MTSGSFVRNNLVPATGGGSWGVYQDKTWSGADRASATKNPHNHYETYREYTDQAGIVRRKDFKIRVPRISATSVDRVVKRSYDEEHAYSMSAQYRSHDRISYTVPSNFSVWSVMDYHGATTWAPANLLDANAQIKLVGKLQDLLYGSDFNLGVFIGESGPALDLLTDTAGRVFGAYRDLRRGDVVGAAGVLLSGTGRGSKKHKNFLPPSQAAKNAGKVLADNWLELQYGWLPLLKDAEAGAQMLAHHFNVPMRKSYRASVRAESNLTRLSQVGYLPTQTAEGRSTRTHRRSLIARIEEAGSIPQFTGLTNPELVAWELVPYSFVADWFIPIGSWLQARALVSHIKGTFITSDKRTGRAHEPTSQYFAYKHRGYFSAVVFTRSISTVLDVPMPTFKPLGKVTSWQHCANAVGLLVSGFAGRRT